MNPRKNGRCLLLLAISSGLLLLPLLLADSTMATMAEDSEATTSGKSSSELAPEDILVLVDDHSSAAALAHGPHHRRRPMKEHLEQAIDQANIDFDDVESEFASLSDIINQELFNLFDREDITVEDLNTALKMVHRGKRTRHTMCRQMRKAIRKLKKSIKKSGTIDSEEHD